MEGKIGLLALCASVVLNALIAYGYFRKGEYPMMLTWSCYSVAIMGFIWQWFVK